MNANEAVILIGHGSLRSAGGASMIRIATRLREEGVASIIEPAFLNFSRPTFAHAVARCREAGAQALVVQPYFLIEGAYVRNDLRALVREMPADMPELPVRIAPAFGHHPALVELTLRRLYAAAPDLAETSSKPDPRQAHGLGLLLMAHGTPLPEANAPLYALLDDLQRATGITYGRVAFLDCNAPDIPGGIHELVEAGATEIITMPYFLHMGRHVREDLPGLIAEAEKQLPHVRLIPAHHLDYDLRLVQVIADRLGEVERVR